MASNLECLGLAGDSSQEGFLRLITRALDSAELVGKAGGLSIRRWTDPSGARLTFGVKRAKLLDFLPSYAGTPGARLADVTAVNNEVAFADVVDESGEVLTRMAVELEERRFLRGSAGGVAAITALGVDVTVHPDKDAFNASDKSLLDADDAGSERPADMDPDLPWPLRVGADSFFPMGMFGAEDEAEAFARLSGIVIHAERRSVPFTGQSFIVARTRTVGFEADVCLPNQLDIPPVGGVISGTVFLAGSMPSLIAQPAPGRTMPWSRKRP